MKIKSFMVIVLASLITLSSLYILIGYDKVRVRAQGDNIDPVLSEPAVYRSEPDAVFSVEYRDLNGDAGEVFLYIDNEDPEPMVTYDNDPYEGQYYEVYINESEIDDDTEFYFYANDTNGSSVTLKDLYQQPFLVGDFLGWGEYPILSNPSVYLDGNFWVFNVTYQDPDGDEADWVSVNINDTYWYDMVTSDSDPFTGQNYIVQVPFKEANDFSWVYFDTSDVNGSYTCLYDEGGNYFILGEILRSNGGGDGDGDGNGGGWRIDWDVFGLNNPEVVVGIIGLVALGCGSAYGAWRRKKKRGRFSELLTQVDDIYSSYKLNPKRCESELEKLKATINDDLKKNTIDEDNYSILKGRIDEIILEIREESLRSQVTEVPKDIELKIKDMLIDGEITRAEYDKLLPIIKGSDMGSADKEKMEKVVGSWVKEDKEKEEE